MSHCGCPCPDLTIWAIANSVPCRWARPAPVHAHLNPLQHLHVQAARLCCCLVPGRLLAPTRWRHGDTLLMCLSTSQIGYSWIMAPNTLPPAYINFLNRHGDAPLHHLAAVRVCVWRTQTAQRPLQGALPLPCRPQLHQPLVQCCVRPRSARAVACGQPCPCSRRSAITQHMACSCGGFRDHYMTTTWQLHSTAWRCAGAGAAKLGRPQAGHPAGAAGHAVGGLCWAAAVRLPARWADVQREVRHLRAAGVPARAACVSAPGHPCHPSRV